MTAKSSPDLHGESKLGDADVTGNPTPLLGHDPAGGDDFDDYDASGHDDSPVHAPESTHDRSNNSHVQDTASAQGSHDNRAAASLTVQPPPIAQAAQAAPQKEPAEDAAFDLWIERNRVRLSEARRQTRKHASLAAGGGQQPARGLPGDVEKQRIITSPRDYQIELFELAKQKNIIAVLDTGSGKTLIAAMLLRWTIEKELEDRAAGKQKRISFFLVDKVALVFQQHDMLACNLDHPVQSLCGDMVGDVWNQALWVKAFSDNMAIVCTADILYKCLHHSFIHMGQVNLLIFDEAHHAKKNHAYARIIKDFYVDVKGQHPLPRIFGTTASPVDAQCDIGRAAFELECLLHSEVATIPDPEVLQRSICKPKTERDVYYRRLLPSWETDLHRSLKTHLGQHDIHKKALTFTRAATSQLGPWCADRFWLVYFNAADTIRIEAKTERAHLGDTSPDARPELHQTQLREAIAVVEGYKLSPVTPDRSLLSSKVLELANILEGIFGREGSESRCIVFVEQRWTAIMLADLFQQPAIGIPGLRAGVLVGSGAAGPTSRTSYIEHKRTIMRLRRGDTNCLFSTSVAEEGLDIQGCDVVIRFDIYGTMIQYIQSRGRARHGNSQYIHMMEEGNYEHTRRVMQNRHDEKTLRSFCVTLPESRQLKGNDVNMDYVLRQDRGQRQYTVPSTRAKLTYKSSLLCLANFTASLPCPPEAALAPDYMVAPAGPGGFHCEVIMPRASPVHSALGRAHSTKQAAKSAAAFEMCLELIKGRYLDDHLQPAFTDRLPAMRNAQLAVSPLKRREYKMRSKPELWSHLGTPQELHVMVLSLSDPGCLGRPSRPLLLLSRRPIPSLARFRMFFGANRCTDASCRTLPQAITVGGESLESLRIFTLKIFEDVFSKEYEGASADMPYFLAPAAIQGHASDFPRASSAQDMVDWETLSFVRETDSIKLAGDEADDFFRDKYVVDPWDGSRKFILRRRRPDLKPRDPLPADVAPPRHRGWDKVTQDITNYSVSLWSRARQRAVWKDDQPVVEAELVPMRRNFLDDIIDQEDTRPQHCFLILEPLRISPLPTDVVAMAHCFPSIIHRIDSILIALDMCRSLGLQLQPELALEAFTKGGTDADKDDPEGVCLQSGMGDNYERLEFLGDCFLKMATTIALFTRNPGRNEFEYHVSRMLLVCNRNLFNKALAAGLQEHIRSAPFSRRAWYPEGLALRRGKGKGQGAGKHHALADKTIADVCEAVIGAAYLTSRRDDNLDMAVRAVTSVVKDEDHDMTSWADYYAAYVPPEWQTAKASPAQVGMARQVADKLGYAFKHPRLLRCAFMHPSYPSRAYEKLPSYQRLEFLGDALLDMACVDYLFRKFPGADPQWLTEHKIAMVSNRFLGCVAASLGFSKHLVSFDGAVQGDVATYVSEITEARSAARAAGGGPAEHARDYWTACSPPPKCLADALEAYVGAVFVDSAYDLAQVRRFFDRHLRPYFADMAPYDALARGHPAALLAGAMRARFRCPAWSLLARDLSPDADADADTDGPAVCACVRVHGHVLAFAVAASRRAAKSAAAGRAVAELGRIASVEAFRARFACRCCLGAAESLRESAT